MLPKHLLNRYLVNATCWRTGEGSIYVESLIIVAPTIAEAERLMYERAKEKASVVRQHTIQYLGPQHTESTFGVEPKHENTSVERPSLNVFEVNQNYASCISCMYKVTEAGVDNYPPN